MNPHSSFSFVFRYKKIIRAANTLKKGTIDINIQPLSLGQTRFFVRGLHDSSDWSSVRLNNASHPYIRVIIVIMVSHPKIGPSFQIWTKNYSKKEKENKKENVGIFREI